MKVLIKLGGTLLDSAESRARLAGEISSAMKQGLQPVVVHGGGKQMSRYLADRGVESRFVNGLRVTTPEVLDAVVKVLAGSVNQELVSAFVACGAPAVGLSGMDALLTEGKPIRSDARLLEGLLDLKYLPVVACLAGDRQGRFYNVNADQMAVSVAGALRVDKLWFLTDVDGVKSSDNVVYSELTISQCRKLIESGVATGGMQAKLESAMDAIQTGAGKLLTGVTCGTRLTPSAAVVPHA
jgi:acetylglutamate kinase